MPFLHLIIVYYGLGAANSSLNIRRGQNREGWIGSLALLLVMRVLEVCTLPLIWCFDNVILRSQASELAMDLAADQRDRKGFLELFGNDLEGTVSDSDLDDAHFCLVYITF